MREGLKTNDTLIAEDDRKNLDEDLIRKKPELILEILKEGQQNGEGEEMVSEAKNGNGEALEKVKGVLGWSNIIMNTGEIYQLLQGVEVKDNDKEEEIVVGKEEKEFESWT